MSDSKKTFPTTGGLLFIIGILKAVVSLFGRFFAWLVEIVAQYVFHLDLKLDTLGLFAANGIEIKFNNGIKIVS